jgi:eukaryotic-like serine/threonine-protein kinase
MLPSAGKKIYFSSNRKVQNHIYAKTADGSGGEETVLESGVVSEYPRSISPDERYLAYVRTEPGTKTGMDIWVLPLFGERKPFPIVATEFTDVNPAISPDGKWMAYSNDETGQMQVYRTPFPGGGSKWQVSTTGGSSPHWRGDGKELFFISDHMMAVDVTLGGGSPQLGTPKPLFQTTAAVSGLSGPFDVTRDGKKFLVHSMSLQLNDTPLTLVTNWTAELKK